MKYFYEISRIPRESCREKEISEYLIKFAEDRNLFYYADDYCNVFIKKTCSPGYENVPSILLQSHTDMVCEKNKNVIRDFHTEGIKIIENNGFLSADGTTLGADNGIGVAFMLSLIGDTSLLHPELEFLFTAQEEIGLIGAEKFDYNLINSRRMINLDAETEGEVIISSAGGTRSAIKYEYDTIPTPINKINKTIKIQITGLTGGHSGIDIYLGRGNANIITGRILNMLYKKYPFNLMSLNGGIKSNAIPRECEAVINVVEYDETMAYLKEIKEIIKQELSSDDNAFNVYINKVTISDIPNKMMTYKSTSMILTILILSMNGVHTMCRDNFDLVESSSNLGVITQDETSALFVYENRSSVENILNSISEKYERLAYITNSEIVHSNKYPGWSYNKNSELVNKYIKIYRQLYNIDPVIKGIHAGLECGIIKNKIVGMDAISIGPDIKGAHTPKECLKINSCHKLWEVLIDLIK